MQGFVSGEVVGAGVGGGSCSCSSSALQSPEVALKRDPTDGRPRHMMGRAKLAEPLRACSENEQEDEDEHEIEDRRRGERSLFLGSAALSQLENHRQAVVTGLFADSAFQVAAVAFVEEVFVVNKE